MTEYYFPETAIVRTDDEGNKRFYLQTRDGEEDQGGEIRLRAKLYNEGTMIEIREAVHE